MNKTILLTGANGFLGRHCFDLLEKRGYDVIPIIRDNWDLLNKSHIENLIDAYKPKYLLHLAWFMGANFKNSLFNLDWFTSSIYLVQEFYKNGGKYAVTVGSCFEYDLYYIIDTVCNEFTTALKPRTMYGIFKKFMYEFLDTWTKQKGCKYAHVRPFYMYGKYEKLNRLVPNIINNLMRDKNITLSDSNLVRDYLYVEDVASAIVDIISKEYNHSVINIGSGNGITLASLAYTIADLLHKDSSLIDFSVNQDEPKIIIADTSLLTNMVRWKPKFTLEEGLSQTIEYWREQQNGN